MMREWNLGFSGGSWVDDYGRRLRWTIRLRASLAATAGQVGVSLSHVRRSFSEGGS